METLIQDLRYGVRMLRKSPGFTSVAVLSLALGIGANTAIFTLMNAVLLKSLPVSKPEELVLFNDTPGEGTSIGDPPSEKWRLFSYPVWTYLRDHDEAFQSLCAFRSGEARLSVIGEGGRSDTAQRAQGHLVSGNFFDVLGVKTVFGRALMNDDDKPSAPPAAVISYGYWKTRWNSDSQVVGRIVLLNGASLRIVGVAPPEFFGERVRKSPDYWLPLVFQPQIEMRESYLGEQDIYWLNMMGRLKPGTTVPQAQERVTAQLRQFLAEQAGSEISEERR